MMQKPILFVLFALLSTMLIVEKCDGNNLVELLQAEQYTVMYDFVNRFPDLVALLTNATVNTTIFAPTNSAFNSIITNDLHNILLYHFVAGENPTSIFTNNELLSSLLILSGLNDTPQKTKVTLNETTLFINQAQVIQPNLYASNGVIHGINAVLSPPGSIVNIASTTPDFSTLYAAIVEAELSSALEGPALTVFAPSNEAFAALVATSPLLVGYLLANDTQARGDLQAVLKYHATGSIIYAGNIPSGTTLVPSLEGANLTVTNNNGAIAVNGAAVTAANVLAANGVIHAIDQVLLPKSFNLNLRQTLLGLGLTTLVNLFETAGLTNLLTGPANFTIFAPTNAAFSALPSPPSGQALIDVLSYHLTPGQVLSTLLSDGTLLPSLLPLPTLQQNQQLKVYRFEDVVGINNANITNANNLASNGLVHVIDRVLIPPKDIAQVANATASLSTLVAAAKAAGLIDALSTTGNLTVFAPDNAAFAAASSVVSYLLTPQGRNDLQNVLLNHVVANTVLYAPSITTTPATYPTLNGENVTVVRNNGQVEVDGKATVLVSDVLASNGVAHVIDTVLLPSNFEFTLEKALIGVGATDLLAAINAAGLHDILNGTTEYTIFAPTNEAFARHPPPSGQALVDLLKYHVVAGRVLAFKNGELFPSLLTLNSLDGGPQQLKSSLSGSSLFMNGVNVTGSASAINGLVYVISDVFTLPPSVEGVVNSTFNVLAKVVQLAGLNGPLDTMSNITLFAPTDTAFSKLSTALLNYLLMPAAKADLVSVLYYHVVPYYVLYAERIPSGVTSYVTINGASVSVDKSAGGISVNNAAVVQADLLAANGVAHGIENVLLPPGFAFDLQRALVGLDATTLLAAIHEAGLDGLLNGTTNYTIFAPTNAAFTALGNVSFAELVQILSYHVVPGYVTSNQLNNGQLLSTLLVEATLLDKPQPVKITLNAGRVWVNGINVTIPDNFASNGVVHVIDAVLIPPKNIPTVATATPALSTLVQLLSAAELVPTLSGSNLTVFAPENSAFSALGEALLTYLLLPSSKSDLVSILGYHVLPNAVVYSAEVPTTPTPVPTLNGADVTVNRQGTTVTVNSATVVVPDVLASNGVVHVVNEVLIPPGFSFNLRKALEALGATVLINLIDKVGLSDVLNGTANFTIFAPTNAALNALPNNLTNAEIAEILKYHVVAGIFRKNSLTNGELLPSLTVLQTLGGKPQLLEVTLSGGSFLINDVNVTSADSLATNGVIHVINEVLLLPPTLPEVAAAAPDFSKLVTLVEAAGIADALKQNNLTLFAPTNEGFASLGPAIYNFLLLPAAKDELVSVLTYHAVGDNILYSTVIPEGETKLKTLNGADITVNKKTNGSITVNTANVVVPNILAANGVAHGIDSVLLPPGFVFDLRRVLIGINATSLLEAIHLTGLDGILNGTTNYTIFAPSDQAFASFNKTNVTVAELADILKYHVVPGTIKSTDLSNGQLLSSLLTLPTLNNKQQRLKVNITGNEVYINNALVTIANNVATNGIVHEINKVLSPPSDIGTVARATPSLSTLVKLIQIVEEEQRFINPNITALAPSNAAFNSLGAATLSYLLSPQAEDALENILLYHIIPDHILYTPDITGTVKVRAANGLDVTFVKSGNKVTVNGASLTVPNVLASNGVAHILSAVLLPSNFHFTLLNALEGLNETELMAAFEAAGLFSILNGTANYTIFAPTPEAFQKHLPKGVASLSTKDLVALLQTHVVAGRFPLEDGMQLPTLNNKTLIVGANATTITLSGTKVTAELLGKGNAANNGMLFSIDKVLAVPGGNKDDDDDGLSTTWIIVIAVVCSVAVIAVLGVGGYFGYTYWQKKQNSYVAIGGDYED